MHEATMPLAEAQRRAKQAYELGRELGREQATAELSADLRALAQLFAEEVRALRCELRAALGQPPLIECSCDCDRDDRLQ